MYDRLKDIEDITDQVRRQVVLSLSDTLGVSVPEDCVHPCMLRWAHTARTVGTRSKSSNQPLEKAESPVKDSPLEDTGTHSANGDREPCHHYIVDYDSDDVPVNHTIHTDFNRHSLHVEQAHTESVLQDWWNMYQPLTDVDEINHLPLEGRIEFVSGINTIEKW